MRPAQFGLFQCPSSLAESDTKPFSMLDIVVTATSTQFLCYYHRYLLTDLAEDSETCGSASSPLLQRLAK